MIVPAASFRSATDLGRRQELPKFDCSTFVGFAELRRPRRQCRLLHRRRFADLLLPSKREA
jgi:hypothetical protein